MPKRKFRYDGVIEITEYDEDTKEPKIEPLRHKGFIITKSSRDGKIKKDISNKLNINFADWKYLVIEQVNMLETKL